MKSLVLVCLFSLFFAVGCGGGTSPVATISANLIESGLTTAIVTTLDCQEGKDVVAADVKTVVDKWFSINQPNNQGGIVKDLCVATITKVVPLVVGTAIPATWKCKITKLDNATTVLSELACSKINA